MWCVKECESELSPTQGGIFVCHRRIETSHNGLYSKARNRSLSRINLFTRNHSSMEFTDDVHMETPPVSSANDPDPLLAHNEEEIPSKEKLIRTNLGKTIAQDFGQYRDILDEHVCY